ncbi:MAG: CHAD domain-containing protein [Syntrophotaleaceae bacterium]
MHDHCYVFNEQCDVAGWLHHLVQGGNWQQEPWLDSQATYYDTFDWRLYRNKHTLELVNTGGCRQLVLRPRSGEPPVTLDRPEDPGFARDLPAGPLREQLAPMTKMRRLLPQARVDCRTQNLFLLNSVGTTVLRLNLFTDRAAIDADGNRLPLHQYLQILPVRGYRSAAKRLAGQWHSDPFVQPAELDPLADALAAFGRLPADYSSKLDLRLQPSQTAQQALLSILQHLLGTLKANISGTCSDLDSEFLHDLRVAVRRTRSALSQLKGLLPPQEVAPFRGEFAWLGNITGPTRDLDVYLLKFGAYLQSLPKNHHSDLAPFQRFLLRRQLQEQKTLAEHLTSPRFTLLISDWQSLLEKERPADSTLADSDRPVKQVADRRIWKLFRRYVDQGQAITSSGPAEALHELRKTGKKLRYLLEFFQSLYPPADISVLIKDLKDLQDSLGDFQDFEVQSEAMHSFGLAMAEAGQATPATLLTMGMLAENLRQQQQQVRQEFYRRFAPFSGDRNQQLFRRLFNTAGGKKSSKPLR